MKNFASALDEKEEKEPSNPDVSPEVKDFNFKKQKNLTSGSKKIELQEVKESDRKRERKLTSESKKIVPQEVNDFFPNYNNTNHNNLSYNDMNYTNPINLVMRVSQKKGLI